MNIPKKLAIKNVKNNKKRSITTVIGIVIAIVFIYLILTLIVSFNISTEKMAKTTAGDYHIRYYGVSLEDVNTLKSYTKSADIDKIGITQELGVVEFKTGNKFKQNLYIEAFDEFSLNNSGLQLIEGRLPENENEIVISEFCINNGDINLKVGDEINLKLNDDINKENIKYKIVGIIKRPYIEIPELKGYAAITELEKTRKEKECNIIIRFNNPQGIYSFEKVMEDVIKYDSSEENTDLLYSQGVYSGIDNKRSLEIFAIMCILIVAIVVWILIKNSFNISIVEKEKYYGILSSVGATTKQIKRSVIYESIIYLLIALPIGIVLGILISLFLIEGTQDILLLANVSTYFKLEFIISIPVIILTTIITFIITYLATYKSAQKATRLSDIEKIRNNKYVKNKKIKSKKGVEKNLAYKNIINNTKMFRVTSISICTSIILFILITCISKYISGAVEVYNADRYNIKIGFNGNINAEEELEYIKQICELDNINYYNINESYQLGVDREFKGISKEIYDSYRYIEVQVYLVDDKVYEKYTRSLNISEKEINNGGILINEFNTNYYTQDDNYLDYKLADIKEGEKLPILINGEKVEIPRTKIVDESYEKFWMKEEGIPSNKEVASQPELVINLNNEYTAKILEKLNNKYITINISSSNPNELEKEVNKLFNEDILDVYNYERQQIENNNRLIIIKLFLYGFLSGIILICIANMFNVIVANIQLREHDFRLMQQIGMTSKQFKKMINYESSIYGIKNLIIAIPIAIILSYLISIFYFGNITDYYFPLIPIVLSIIFLLISINFVMKIAVNRIIKYK